MIFPPQNLNVVKFINIQKKIDFWVQLPIDGIIDYIDGYVSVV